MPSVDYTLNNTPPGVIALPSQVPSNGAPGVIPLASSAGTNSEPAAIDLPATAGTGVAPALVPRPSQTPDNTAAAAIALPSQTTDAAAPGIVSGAIIRSTSDTPRIIRYTAPIAPLTDENVYTPILKIEGALVLANIYGQTRIPVASVLERLQVALEAAIPEGDSTLTLVDDAGVSYGVSITIPAGERFAEYVLPAPLALPAGSNVHAKCSARPNGGAPGGFGVVTMFMRISS